MKQIECQLHCKATAKLSMAVAKEMRDEDKNLEEILAKENNDSENSPKSTD